MNKRGQLFILTSVLLSIFLVGMAFTINSVTANDPDLTFKNYADDIDRETGQILNYEVYNNIQQEKIEVFVSILETDFKDREINANFLIIYGNSTLMRVKNLGTQGIIIDDGSVSSTLQGSSQAIESKIKLGGFTGTVVKDLTENTELNLTGMGNSLNIIFNERTYNFKISEDLNQVIFIIQKDFNDETFVEVR